MVGVQNGIWVMGLYRLASEEFDDKAQTDYRNIILEMKFEGLFRLKFYQATLLCLSYQLIEDEDSGLPKQGILPISAEKTQ